MSNKHYEQYKLIQYILYFNCFLLYILSIRDKILTSDKAGSYLVSAAGIGGAARLWDCRAEIIKVIYQLRNNFYIRYDSSEVTVGQNKLESSELVSL